MLEWVVGEGRASWHQARAGEFHAGYVTGFDSRESAEAWVAQAKANREAKGLRPVSYLVQQRTAQASR